MAVLQSRLPVADLGLVAIGPGTVAQLFDNANRILWIGGLGFEWINQIIVLLSQPVPPVISDKTGERDIGRDGGPLGQFLPMAFPRRFVPALEFTIGPEFSTERDLGPEFQLPRGDFRDR